MLRRVLFALALLLCTAAPSLGQRVYWGYQCPGPLTEEVTRAVRLTATGCDIAFGVSVQHERVEFDVTLLPTHLHDWTLTGEEKRYGHRPGPDRRWHGAAFLFSPSITVGFRPVGGRVGLGIGLLCISGNYDHGATPMCTPTVPVRVETPRVYGFRLRGHLDCAVPRDSRFTVYAQWQNQTDAGWVVDLDEPHGNSILCPVSLFLSLEAP